MTNEILHIKDWLAVSNGKQFEFNDHSFDIVVRLKDGQEFTVFEQVDSKSFKSQYYIAGFMSDHIHVYFGDEKYIEINDIEKFYPIKKT